MEEFAKWMVQLVYDWGYWGVFITTFLESTFVPLPAELTMIPAGYLVAQGKMNGALVLFLSVVGTILGSLFNYYLAVYFGRSFLEKYGRYVFFTSAKMDKMDNFFKCHGEISILTGRLIPGLRHFISFPAGLWRMDLKKFCIYTGIGGCIWMFVLMMIGYMIDGNEEKAKQVIPYATIGAALVVVIGVIWYIRRLKKNAGAVQK